MTVAAAVSSFRALPWPIWRRQLVAVLRIELRKNLFTRRGFWIYMLAFAPVVIITLHGVFDSARRGCSLSEDTQALAGIFQFYYLRLGIFFGCMGIFTWLFRGEVAEKSLHYYFLVPMRRELLVVGKFLAGAITAIVLFGAGVLMSFIIMYVHLGPLGREFVLYGPGLGHLGAYLLVTALACIGYGAMFLALSLVFKNPIVPGIIIMGWETVSGVLPSLLQKLTVTFYLKHLSPVQVPVEGIFALFTVVVDPVPPIVAVIGLNILSAAILVFACWRVRHFEISYATEQ